MTDALQLGAFNHHLGLLSFTATDEGATAHSALAAGDALPPRLAENLEVAFEVGCLAHELQHLADVFGTAAGLSLITSGLHWVKRFAMLCDYAKLRRRHDRSWAPDDGWLAEKAEILRGFRFALRAEKVFSRPFEPFEGDVPGDLLFAHVHHAGDGAISRVTREGRLRTLIEPLGFEALIEANAHAHVRSVIDSNFPSLSFEGQLRSRLLPLHADAAGMATPYMTVDILLSRWFRSHDIGEFPRSLVHDLIDRALADAHFTFGDVDSYGVIVPMRPVGMILEHILSKLDPRTVLSEGIPRKADSDSLYIKLSDALDAGADWDTVEGEYFDSGVRVWETWVAKHLTAPLLRRRAAVSGSLISQPGALKMVAEMAPVVVRNGRISKMNMPEPVRQAWLKTAFLTSVLHQMTTQSAAFCPRRYSLLPGLTSVLGLSRRGTCDRNAEFGCGSTAGMLVDGEFDCLFEDVVTAARARQVP